MKRPRPVAARVQRCWGGHWVRSPCATIPVDFRAPIDYLRSLRCIRPLFHHGTPLAPGSSHRRRLAHPRLLIAVPAAHSQGFKFSDPDPSQQAERQAEAMKQDRIAYELSTPCRNDLKGKKIMVVIGEQQGNGYVSAQQQNYGPHFQAINGRLRSLGLRTFTPEEIRAQVKQAEIDAYFRNDPDGAHGRREAPRRELRAARPHLVAGDHEPDHRA